MSIVHNVSLFTIREHMNNLNAGWSVLYKILENQPLVAAIRTYLFRQYSLANFTGLQAVIEEMEPRQRVGADAIINVREENKRWRFYVEVKPHPTSHTLGAAILAVSQIKKEHHSAALVTPDINPSQAEKLRELGIQFLMQPVTRPFNRKAYTCSLPVESLKQPKL